MKFNGQPVRDRCHRCDREWSEGAQDAALWNVEVRQGVAQWLLCPACQSPEESVEAEVNLATMEYALDTFGRMVARPKGETQ